jgi:hypothetical protein
MFNFLRSIHLHKWKTVFSEMATSGRSYIFSSPSEFSEACELRIEKCSVCNQERGLMITVDRKTRLDPGYIRAYWKHCSE